MDLLALFSSVPGDFLTSFESLSKPYSMKKVLILFAHPHFEQSRTNRALLHALKELNFITIHDLYEQYRRVLQTLAQSPSLRAVREFTFLNN